MTVPSERVVSQLPLQGLGDELKAHTASEQVKAVLAVVGSSGVRSAELEAAVAIEDVSQRSEDDWRSNPERITVLTRLYHLRTGSTLRLA